MSFVARIVVDLPLFLTMTMFPLVARCSAKADACLCDLIFIFILVSFDWFGLIELSRQYQLLMPIDSQLIRLAVSIFKELDVLQASQVIDLGLLERLEVIDN